MVLLEEEIQPNAEAEGKQGMSSETVDSRDVVGSMTVSMSRENVADVDGNSEETKEIRVSTMSDVKSHASDMRNEHLSPSDSSLSMFDDSAASGTSRSSSGNLPYYVGHHYDVGDMVWGKVKSHPWWPGHIYSDTFASPAVRRTKRPGHFLVAFYGDSSYGWFDPEELIPFVPNFDEKSQQLNSRTFVKAVEEAIDEISRRSSMGLSCRCRNPYNFRPTEFQGFLAVDVSDYESGAVYPVKQIEKARDRFQPSEALEFIKMVAIMSINVDSGKISVMQNKATAISYRRAAFEEFDDTYAQAFGDKADRPPRLSLEVLHTAKAPLSGPLVIQESMSKKKSSIKLSKPKETNKDRYLFKRREDPNEPKTNQKKQITTSIMPTAYIEGSEEVASGDFVLQKRAPPVSLTQSTIGTEVKIAEAKPSSSIERESDPKPKADYHYQEEIGLAIAKSHRQEPDSGGKVIPSQTGLPKKSKAFKRPVEIDIEKSGQGETRKKVKKELGMEMSSEEQRKKKLTDGKRSSLHEVKDERHDLKLAELLGSLQGLAMDPFHSFDIYFPKMVKNAIMQFRSQVFQKSLASTTTIDIDPPVESDNHLAEKHSVKQQAKPQTNRPGPAVDPSKVVVKKRELSDRQEESAVKRVKKIMDLKSKATTKPSSVKADTITKTITRIRESTALVMKFPPHVSLPSASELKARLARFGPLDQLGTRIFYKTYTCRVVFLYKNDAMAANNHLSSGSSCLFGNIQLKCHVRDMNSTLLDSEPNKILREDTTTTIINPAPMIVRNPLQQQQLKSCLKKPTGDDGLGTIGNGSRVPGRVKFISGLVEESSPTDIITTGNSSSMTTPSSCCSSSSSHGFDHNNTIGKSCNNRPVSLPTTATTTTIDHNNPNLPLSKNVEVKAAPKKADVGLEMLRLLAKCGDVVAKVSNYLGYTPYHSL
ncbi:PWWP domain-containing protein 1-like [Impatiens glandulifera]|uniref:PWWP domain-containing protein 1-like n=1 Tax=Impatiens glandulifera TaxID=253017 RepID=UPI001FB068A1|nr:PWWP domain-containing protein 1-like [Impatiens glandulifera]XP_047315794.1 PWWP domain-containing protein 1-like [Impatiens glandulifera]